MAPGKWKGAVASFVVHSCCRHVVSNFSKFF